MTIHENDETKLIIKFLKSNIDVIQTDPKLLSNITETCSRLELCVWETMTEYAQDERIRKKKE